MVLQGCRVKWDSQKDVMVRLQSLHQCFYSFFFSRYPFIYIITVLPIAVTRWLTFSDTNLVVPFGATAFSAIMFSLSGFFNVVLFTWTRPALMPANKRRPSINIQVSRTTYSTRGAGGAAAGAHASGPYPHHRGKPRVSGSIVMDFEEDERRMSDNYDMQTMGSPTTVHGVLAPKLYPEVTAHLDLERATRESPQLEKVRNLPSISQPS